MVNADRCLCVLGECEENTQRQSACNCDQICDYAIAFQLFILHEFLIKAAACRQRLNLPSAGLDCDNVSSVAWPPSRRGLEYCDTGFPALLWSVCVRLCVLRVDSLFDKWTSALRTNGVKCKILRAAGRVFVHVDGVESARHGGTHAHAERPFGYHIIVVLLHLGTDGKRPSGWHFGGVNTRARDVMINLVRREVSVRSNWSNPVRIRVWICVHRGTLTNDRKGAAICFNHIAAFYEMLQWNIILFWMVTIKVFHLLAIFAHIQMRLFPQVMLIYAWWVWKWLMVHERRRRVWLGGWRHEPNHSCQLLTPSPTAGFTSRR